MTTSTTSFPYTGSTVIWTVPEYVKPGSFLTWVIGDVGTVVSGGVTYPGGSYPANADYLYDITVDVGGSASVTYTTVDAPLAPTASGPPVGQLVDLRMGTTFTWVYNPGTDSGTESGWILKVVVGTKTWYWQNDNQTWDDAPSVNSPMINPSGATSLTIPGSAWDYIASNGEPITWQIATTESYFNLESPYSTAQTFTGGFANSSSTSSARAIMSVNNSITSAVSDSSSDQVNPTKILASAGSISGASTVAVITNVLGQPIGFVASYSIVANPIEFLFDHTIIGSLNSISQMLIQPLESEVITGADIFSYSILSTSIDVANASMAASSITISLMIGRPGTQNDEPLAGQSLSATDASVSSVIERGLIVSSVSETSIDIVSPQKLTIITNIESGGYLPLQRGLGLLGSAPLQQLLLGSADVNAANSFLPLQRGWGLLGSAPLQKLLLGSFDLPNAATGAVGFATISSAQVSAGIIYFIEGSSQSASSATSSLIEGEHPLTTSPIIAISEAQALTQAAALRTITRALSISISSATGQTASSELVTAAGILSVSWVQAALGSLLGIFIEQTDVGVGVESQPAPTIQAALLNHFLDTYVVPDPKIWEIENERARHDQALYRYGEYGIFVLMWTQQDFEAGLVGRCNTCYVPAEPVSDTWKQPAYFKCPDCLGTSFEGGYKAILVRPSLWQWDEPKLQQDKRGVINTNVATVQTTADFRMQPKDYIIRGDGSRWQVQTMEGTHLDTGFGTQSGIWDATQFTYTNVTREDESSPIYLLPFSEQFIQQAIPQYYSREPVEFS